MQPMNLRRVVQQFANYYENVLDRYAFMHATDGLPLNLQKAHRSVNGAAACATFCVAYSILASVQDATLEPTIPASQDRIHSLLRRTVPKLEFPMSRADQILVDIADSCRPIRYIQNNFEAEVVTFIADEAEDDKGALQLLNDIMNHGMPVGQQRPKAAMISQYNAYVAFTETNFDALPKSLSPVGIGTDWKMLKVSIHGNTLRYFSSAPLLDDSPQAYARARFYHEFITNALPSWLTQSGSSTSDPFFEPLARRPFTQPC